MLKITQKATDHLIRIRGERGFDATFGARFVRGSSGVGLTFARTPREQDDVLAGSDLAVYIAEDVADALDRAIIDETSDERGPKLIVRLQEDGSGGLEPESA